MKQRNSSSATGNQISINIKIGLIIWPKLTYNTVMKYHQLARQSCKLVTTNITIYERIDPKHISMHIVFKELITMYFFTT